jgi:hypothetical protein
VAVTSIEGIGEAVTGGLIARAVESGAGETGGEQPGNCLNCGAPLAGAYCHACGQKGHVHRTLAAFWHDLAHGVLHFEGKTWRTLPMLAWRPGELTRRYIAGERARFVSPMALFLFSVFLMFAVFSWIGGPFAFQGNPLRLAQARTEAANDHAARRNRTMSALHGFQGARARAAAAGASTAGPDRDIADAQRLLAAQDSDYRRMLERLDRGELSEAQAGSTQDEDRLGVELGETPSGIEWLNEAWRRAKRNPDLLIYKLETNGYKFSWALIPISVPFLWLLFLHRRRYRRFTAFDHTVFVTYSIAFMSLALIALSLLRPLGLGGRIMGLAILLVPPIHIYRQLRGAYLLSRFSALWRTVALLVFAAIAAALFFLLLVLLGALE